MDYDHSRVMLREANDTGPIRRSAIESMETSCALCYSSRAGFSGRADTSK